MSEVHCAFGRPPGPHDSLVRFSDPDALDTARPAKASSGTKKRRAASKDKHGHPSGRKSPGHDPKAAADKAKREEYLRKNREAASKCRAKKKDWTQQMDERYRDLATRNQLLRAELDTLSNSVYELKEMVLQHADCGFFPIEGFLQAEAKKVQASVRSRPFAETSTQPSPPDRVSSYAQSGARLSVDDAGGISGYGSMSPPSGTAWTGMGYTDPASFSSVSTAEGLGSGHGWFGKLQQT
ncbi:cAMP response element binding (CREB) protein [Neofusicoccum parvum]|uniref:cAMP response element binding (CREB) protein n=1 Tax=Neofusicoccum parvum TaxID=310453 RepID=A0ACB5SCN8_9PEZI|nr:cAMP response element binding (CREB) protein [Neofusicoccum parvum]GME64195.1 cAMP response element binding (CREB) protein [Neofusicoccum parvum]